MVTSTRGSPPHECMCQPASVRQEESGLILTINGHQHPEQSPSSTSRRVATRQYRSEQAPSSTYLFKGTWGSPIINVTWGGSPPGVAPHQHCMEQTPSSM